MGLPDIRRTIRFWLNDRLIELDDVTPTQNLLDFLRLDRRLCGTKEGCAEGDCGACTLLVGRLMQGELIYEAVNACIRFTASLDGCHVVTVEHLTSSGGELHPVQQALVDFHGSQCGFCSPGIVMSLYALWMNNPNADRQMIERALQGNLCRCTGYAPIVKGAQSALKNGGQSDDLLVRERSLNFDRLSALKDGARVSLGQILLPADVDDLAILLEEFPDATLVAGATDVGLWVTKFMRDLGKVIFTGHLEELHIILEGEGAVTFGAGVTYSEFWPVIVRQFPALQEFWSRIGGEQVRNMGTIGGNIANGSPIGDTPPALIALGAVIVLRKGGKRRFVRLEDYFISYGKQDRDMGEFIESVTIPYAEAHNHVAVHKISKRREEDISTVCGAFRLALDDLGKVQEIVIAFGGMAATPKRAGNVEKALLGQMWNEKNIETARTVFEQDFMPMSDVRGSAAYRLLAAQNLLKRFYLETVEKT